MYKIELSLEETAKDFFRDTSKILKLNRKNAQHKNKVYLINDFNKSI